MSFKRGSEWKKWDLHVHTPLSIVQQYGGNSDVVWEKYIKDLENLPSEFKVLGINDYLFLDGYSKLKKEKEENGRLTNIELLLPVVEFRIEKFAGVDFGSLQRINLHVIFSNEVTVETIQSQFLNTLEQSYQIENGGDSWSRAITRESVSELGEKIINGAPADQRHKYGSLLTEGFNNLNVKEEQIFKSLEKDCFKGKFLIAIGKTEWDQLKWTDASILTKKDIINKADIIFTSAQSIEAFNNAKRKLTHQGVKDLLLDCSDAHRYSDDSNKDRIGKCYTWIKANQTFDGLKQIIYEPELRVAFGDTNPYEINPKPFFSQINFNEQLDVFGDSRLHIEQQVINLNRDLVAIIGGRGSGKSILLDVILKAFEKSSTKNERINSLKDSQDITIEYNKIDMDKLIFIHSETNNLDYVHISQGEVKDVIRDEQKLSEEIFRMLNISSDISSSIGKELMGIFNDYCNELDSMGKIDLSNTEIQIKKYQDLIANLQNEKNKEKVNEFVKNEEKKNNLESLKQQINKSLQEFNILEEKINGEVKEISDKYQELCKTEIILHNVDFSVQKNDFQHMSSQISILQEECEELNKKIKQQFIEMDIKDDIKSLTEKLAEYEKKLSEQKRIIKDAEESQKKKDAIISNFIRIANELSQQYTNKKNEILRKWSDKSNQDTPSSESDKVQILKLLSEGINIDVEISFDKQKFMSIFDEGINGQKFRQAGGKTKIQRINEEILDISSYDDFVAFIRNELKFTNTNVGIFDFIEKELNIDDYFYSKQDLIKKVLQNLQNILSVRPVLQIIDNSGVYKTTNQLSAGQKGTLYTKIKLLTNAFDTPVLFDQPEDDLDNDFIMKSLVHLFRQLKKYRQIIIVTHNPNLVINADAEQVIIAKNREESISYLCGAIEEEEIRREICQILEGGEEAFKKREQKYNI